MTANVQADLIAILVPSLVTVVSVAVTNDAAAAVVSVVTLVRVVVLMEIASLVLALTAGISVGNSAALVALTVLIVISVRLTLASGVLTANVQADLIEILVSSLVTVVSVAVTNDAAVAVTSATHNVALRLVHAMSTLLPAETSRRFQLGFLRKNSIKKRCAH